eukprot:scaffold1991_cov111-Isochrysis_galbana.AAC.15
MASAAAASERLVAARSGAACWPGLDVRTGCSCASGATVSGPFSALGSGLGKVFRGRKPPRKEGRLFGIGLPPGHFCGHFCAGVRRNASESVGRFSTVCACCSLCAHIGCGGSCCSKISRCATGPIGIAAPALAPVAAGSVCGNRFSTAPSMAFLSSLWRRYSALISGVRTSFVGFVPCAALYDRSKLLSMERTRSISIVRGSAAIGAGGWGRRETKIERFPTQIGNSVLYIHGFPISHTKGGLLLTMKVLDLD